jgi:hypothetical protein
VAGTRPRYSLLSRRRRSRLAHPKTEKDDLSKAEKQAIKRLIEEIEGQFAGGYRK